MWSSVILWAVGLTEFLIFCYCCSYVALYVIPWGELREKREISRGIAKRLPDLRARVRRSVRRARAAPLIPNPPSVRDMCRRMTDDVVALAEHCDKTVETISREHGMWPREMLVLEDILRNTLDVLETMCGMRNAELPRLAKAYVEMALERIGQVDSVREQLLARITVLSKDGACYDYEKQCLQMLGNALQAHRLLVEADPGKVVALSARWFARLRQVAEIVELRGVTQRRLAEVRSEFPERAERVRLLLGSVRALLPILRKTSAHKSVALRMVVLESADEGIVQVERELATAEAVCCAPGVDVGTSGQSGRALAEALRSAERADAILSGFEGDLAFIAAVAAASGESAGEAN